MGLGSYGIGYPELEALGYSTPSLPGLGEFQVRDGRAVCSHTRKKRAYGAPLFMKPVLTPGFLYFLDKRRHYIEQVPDYAVVGYFEDGGFGIFVDGDDGA